MLRADTFIVDVFRNHINYWKKCISITDRTVDRSSIDAGFQKMERPYVTTSANKRNVSYTRKTELM